MKRTFRTGRTVTHALIAATVFLPTLPALTAQDESAPEIIIVQPAEADLNAFIDLVREDIVVEKATIIAANIAFTDEEAYAFWDLYGAYTIELNKLLDQRLALIRRHVGSFDALTDPQAQEMANEVFDLEGRRLELKRTWFARFADAIGPKKAAQFFQIENQINAALDLRIAAALPLIK